MTGPFWISDDEPDLVFPPVDLALDDPNGLLAVGGDLSPNRLISAYRHGVFPWFNHGQPILWWSPNPRAVLFPDQLHISRSLKKQIKLATLDITFDQNFEAVITACAAPRNEDPGTWITAEMHNAYIKLHKLGIAHSVEAWQNGALVGGLYGLGIGRIFFGESMFSRVSNASKIAFVYLVKQLQQWQFALIDCQVKSQHLRNFGATDIKRNTFIQILHKHINENDNNGIWHFDQSFNPLNDQIIYPTSQNDTARKS